MRPNLVMLAAAALLAGCGGGFQRNTPEPTIYLLTAPTAQAGPAGTADLLVLQPVVVPALATQRIATRWPDNHVDYYAGARWSGGLGGVVQAMLVESCRRSARFRTVQADPGSFQANYVLGVDVQRFEADYATAGAPVAHVTMTATIARTADRKALASWTVDAEQAASANTLTAVTAALDAAFGKAGADLVNHAADAIVADASQAR